MVGTPIGLSQASSNGHYGAALLPNAFGLWRRAHPWSDLGALWHLVCGGIGFFSMFNIPTIGESGVIAQRFMVPIVLLVPLMAMALVGYHSRKWKVILVCVPVVAASMYVGRVEHGYDTRLEDYIRNTCDQLPEESVFIIETDGMIFRHAVCAGSARPLSRGLGGAS